jgi:cysteine-rich secretory family protein
VRASYCSMHALCACGSIPCFWYTSGTMTRFAESLLQLATGRLLWANLAALMCIKLLLPLGNGGMAAITEQLHTFTPADVVRLTNEHRRAAHLSDVRPNATLDAAAARKLDDMAARQYFAHQNPEGKQPWDFMRAAGYRYRSAGENLAKGFSDPSVLVNAWMNSPSHRANLVNAGYRDIGVAVRRVTLNGVSTLLVVQMFGAPQAIAAAPASAPVAPAPKSGAISTERSIAPVRAPVSVTIPAGAHAARIVDFFNSALMAELAFLLALLSAVVVWMRFHARALASWSISAAMLALSASLPGILPATSGFIF